MESEVWLRSADSSRAIGPAIYVQCVSLDFPSFDILKYKLQMAIAKKIADVLTSF